MPHVEVLVATMNQNNFDKVKAMNIRSDALFANQTNEFSYIEEVNTNNNIRMISTSERGVGKNRNIALLLSTQSICLLADDDVVYVDNYEEIILNAFNNMPEADIIIFNVETIGENKNRRINKSTKRIRNYNFLNYGAVRIAFRREIVIRNNLWFSLKFGGGADYSAGEDSLFLKECLNKKLKIFAYPKKIATVYQGESTWFKGYNDKYFFDKGAFFEAAFSRFKLPIILYYSLKFRRYSLIRVCKLMLLGAKAFKRNLTYEEWEKESCNNN